MLRHLFRPLWGQPWFLWLYLLLQATHGFPGLVLTSKAYDFRCCLSISSCVSGAWGLYCPFHSEVQE